MSFKRPISVIAFDRKSNDYADLPAECGWRHYYIHDESFRLALDAPEGLPADIWINVLATSFCARAGLKAAWVTFANVLRWLVEVLNPGPTASLLWPDFQLVLDVLNASPDTLFSAKPEYTRSLKQSLEGITQASGELFRAFRGFQAERDLIALGQSAVISMPNMYPSWTRQYFTDLILAQILHGRMHTSHRVDGTEVLIVIEEADPDVSTEAEQMFPDHLSPVAQCFKQGREFGISVIVSISSLRSASRLVLANATDQFTFRMSDMESVYDAGRTLMLPAKGELRLNSLQPGECIVRQIGPWPHALVAKVDYMPPCRMRPGQYDTHPYVPSKRLAELPHVQEALAKKIADNRGAALRMPTQRPTPRPLGKLARQFLDRASLPENIFAPVHVMFRHVGNVAPATQLGMMQELERAGFVAFTQVRIGKANLKLKEITEKGWAYLQKPAPTTGGKGGMEHRHYQRWIYDWAARRGYQDCAIEPPVPGTTHFGDVGFRTNGRLHIVQVTAHCDSNITSHVRAALIESRAVDVLVFVTTVKSQHDAIRAKILADPDLVFCIDRIRFDVLDVYLKELWP
jgi:hypothetical protein